MTLLYIQLILSLIFSVSTIAQVGLRNQGNIHIHKGAKLGIFCDLENNSYFVSENSLVGFYSTSNSLSINGNSPLILYNVESKVKKDLYIDTNLDVYGNFNFRKGKLISSRDENKINITFHNYASTSNSNDDKYIDAYATYKGIQEFILPLGDHNQLKSIIFPIQVESNKFESVYHYSDPSIETGENKKNIENTSKKEFWKLKSMAKSSVSLSWNRQSEIDLLVEDLQYLIVIGWNIANKRWEDLGNIKISGNIDKGIISSNIFDANDYSMLSFGSKYEELIPYTSNWGISPNKDNINEYLYLQEAIEHPNNDIKIFNRWGIVVYSEQNYKNTFNGQQNTSNLNLGENKLPIGTYYYVLKLHDIGKTKKGYIYINY